MHDQKGYEELEVEFCSLLTYALDGVNFCLHFPATLRPGIKSRYHFQYVRLKNLLSPKGWIHKVHLFQAMNFVLSFCLEASAFNFDRTISYPAFL